MKRIRDFVGYQEQLNQKHKTPMKTQNRKAPTLQPVTNQMPQPLVTTNRNEDQKCPAALAARLAVVTHLMGVLGDLKPHLNQALSELHKEYYTGDYVEGESEYWDFLRQVAVLRLSIWNTQIALCSFNDEVKYNSGLELGFSMPGDHSDFLQEHAENILV
jgi:hypothetical protein